MPIYSLTITYATGYTSVQTFPTAYDRALFMVGLSSQPVVLRATDYPDHDPHHLASRAASVSPEMGNPEGAQ